MLRPLLLTLVLLLLLTCGTDQTTPGTAAATSGTVTPTVAGGDTTARVVSLDFQDVDLPERHYLVFRQRLPLVDMAGFLAMEAKKLGEAAGAKSVVITGPPTALFYDWDTDSRMGEAAVALPVAAGTKLPPYVTVTLPAQRGISLDMAGPYDGIGAMHYGLESEINRRGLTADLPTVEEYLVGPGDTDDPAEFVTRITYLLK